MPPIELDKRVLKEDYCNFDLIARCWNDEYRGRVWKNRERVADCDGTDLDEIMAELRSVVDDIQHKKRVKRGRRKPTPREIADAIVSLDTKITRPQKLMLAIHAKSAGLRLNMKAISRVGDFATAEGAFEEYAELARRIGDELAYVPGSRKKDVYPAVTLLFTDEIVIGSITPETVLTLRPDIAKAVELLKW